MVVENEPGKTKTKQSVLETSHLWKFTNNVQKLKRKIKDILLLKIYSQPIWSELHENFFHFKQRIYSKQFVQKESTVSPTLLVGQKLVD